MRRRMTMLALFLALWVGKCLAQNPMPPAQQEPTAPAKTVGKRLTLQEAEAVALQENARARRALAELGGRMR